jgi:pilus assembly protein CpaE
VQETATIVLGLDPPELAEEVMDFLDRTGRTRVVATASTGLDLARAVRDRQPHAVVGQPTLVGQAGPLNGSAYFALATSESVSVLREALRAGARGFYLWPGERSQLAHAASLASPPPDRPDGKRSFTVAVYGPRGGAGTTFVATHLAASFARIGQNAVLVDLDPVFGDLTPALGVPPDPPARTVADLARVANELGPHHLEEALWRHPAGFRALLAPGDVRAAKGVGSLHYSAAITVLSTAVDALVLHAPRRLDEQTLAAVEMAERILVVISLDVLAFRAAKRALEIFESGGMAGRCQIVVNRAARGEVAPPDVERVFGAPAAAVLKADRAVGPAQDRGALLPPRNATARAIDRLVRSLVGARPSSGGSEAMGVGA